MERRKKVYRLAATEIRPVAMGHGACMASDRITVDGQRVGYTYRQSPSHAADSGWVFLAGDENEEYMESPDNFGIYDCNTIANYDPGIIPLLDRPRGSAFHRDEETGGFEVDPLGAPSEDD